MSRHIELDSLTYPNFARLGYHFGYIFGLLNGICDQFFELIVNSTSVGFRVLPISPYQRYFDGLG